MRRNHPLNCWYVAALSEEIGYEPTARTLLERPVVLYRRESDDVVALENRCAHRDYPLSQGRIVGDDIVCGYHGCTYDPTGRCIRMPSQPTVPLAALVAAFPVIERPPFVWIWMGEPLAASLHQPPTVAWLSSSRWVGSADVARVEANFVLLHEHYLDLTHMFVVHPEAIPPGISELPPMDGVEVSETTVAYSRRLPPAPLAEWERRATRLTTDRLYRRSEEGLFASPALHVGRYAIEGDDGTSYDHLRIQAFTPESSTSTHVFLQVARNYDLDRGPLTTYLQTMFARLALRDREIVEVIQRHRASAPLGGWPNVNVTADRAATRTRMVIRKMVADEVGRSSASPGTGR